ncbi:hypothetical protein AV530_005903 [Patagioenas fasciata monilis]|uniref:Uncharacterized protein n=1 Tax=Patagioenas fasciata monilis TaxID=372326 RepID=A0A1V4JN11_PATFA|nr:hypothetical protein AV530_005903 [Patagioenas fasciata monilis]
MLKIGNTMRQIEIKVTTAIVTLATLEFVLLDHSKCIRRPPCNKILAICSSLANGIAVHKLLQDSSLQIGWFVTDVATPSHMTNYTCNCCKIVI